MFSQDEQSPDPYEAEDLQLPLLGVSDDGSLELGTLELAEDDGEDDVEDDGEDDGDPQAAAAHGRNPTNSQTPPAPHSISESSFANETHLARQYVPEGMGCFFLKPEIRL